jgi:hypothetical protein
VLTVEMALRTRLHYAHPEKTKWLYEDASLGNLIDLAGKDGLLTDHWNTKAIRELRNHLAHVKETATITPGQAEQDLRLVAEFINDLWRPEARNEQTRAAILAASGA